MPLLVCAYVLAVSQGSRGSASAQSEPGALLDALRLGERTGGFEPVLHDGDDFGTSVTRLGDLDGDGIAELAVGAPGGDQGGLDRGVVWILFRDASGRVRRTVRIGSGSAGFAGQLDDSDRFGHAVTGIGDLDGDGVPDLAVGAPGDDDGGSVIFPDPSVGAVWILFMQREGRVDRHVKLSSTSGGMTSPLNELDAFGSSLASMGDFDGDGELDLAVGAPGDNDAGINAGAIWILSLGADGTTTGQTKIPVGGASTGIGQSVAYLGDLNGDAVGDLAVAGSLIDQLTGELSGYVILIFMQLDGQVLSLFELQAPVGTTDDFGSSVAAIGDVDEDGVVDLAIGAALDDNGGQDAGAVYIARMLPAGFVKGYTLIDATNARLAPHLPSGDSKLGLCVAALGDENGDGVPDLLAGAPGENGLGDDRGAVWSLSLGNGKWANLGSGLEGLTGTPKLLGKGPLETGSIVGLSVDGARPESRAYLIVGADRIDTPFFGGVLVPSPDLVRAGAETDATGQLDYGLRWPATISQGSTFYYQVWIQDEAARFGYAATNAVSSTNR